MAQGKITPKQQEILDYIKSQILERGFPPAVRDICEAVHLKSTSSVHSHLETLEKFYKSIEIKEGDTLWGIAKEYRGDDYDSIYDYIDEVMPINGLTSDQIHAGQYLTVAYYDTQAR